MPYDQYNIHFNEFASTNDMANAKKILMDVVIGWLITGELQEKNLLKC